MATTVTFTRDGTVNGTDYTAGQTTDLPDLDARFACVNGLAVLGDAPTPGPSGGRPVVAFPTGSEPSLTGVPDGTLWLEYTP